MSDADGIEAHDKATHDPVYLYCIRVRGDRIVFFVTGTKPGEKRTKDGAERIGCLRA